MLVEDVGRRPIGEGLPPAEPRRNLAKDPPVGPRLARRIEECALARDAPLGVGDRAVLLAPRRRRQPHLRQVRRIVAGDVLRDDQRLQPPERLAHVVGARQADGGVGAHHPQQLDIACGHRLEHLHGLVAFARDQVRRVPEPAHAIALGRRKSHMRSQHVGEPADLAPAHGVRLAGERQRPRAGLADAARGQVAIDDGVDLVGAVRRLVHALRIAGDDPLADRPPPVELLDVVAVEAGDVRDLGDASGLHAGAGQRRGEAFGVLVDEAPVERAVVAEPAEQAVPQLGIGAGLDGQSADRRLRWWRCGADRC